MKTSTMTDKNKHTLCTKCSTRKPAYEMRTNTICNECVGVKSVKNLMWAAKRIDELESAITAIEKVIDAEKADDQTIFEILLILQDLEENI